MLLIGSQALFYYQKLVGRVPADFDIITSKRKETITAKNRTYEFQSFACDSTNKPLYGWSLKNSFSTYYDKIIHAHIAPLAVLKLLKLASAPHLDKAKHLWDLQQLEGIEIPSEIYPLLAERSENIRKRVEDQKKQFFDKYDIKRFFEHDELHRYVQEDPTYLKAVDVVTIQPNLFEVLSQDEKISLVLEECLVLALERELIPQIRKAPMLAEFFFKRFSVCDTSSTPALRWLSRLSVPGKLADHPEWLASWINANINNILAVLPGWWNDKVNALPEEMWLRVLRR